MISSNFFVGKALINVDLTLKLSLIIALAVVNSQRVYQSLLVNSDEINGD